MKINVNDNNYFDFQIFYSLNTNNKDEFQNNLKHFKLKEIDKMNFKDLIEFSLKNTNENLSIRVKPDILKFNEEDFLQTIQNISLEEEMKVKSFLKTYFSKIEKEVEKIDSKENQRLQLDLSINSDGCYIRLIEFERTSVGVDIDSKNVIFDFELPHFFYTEKEFIVSIASFCIISNILNFLT